MTNSIFLRKLNTEQKLWQIFFFCRLISSRYYLAVVDLSSLVSSMYNVTFDYFNYRQCHDTVLTMIMYQGSSILYRKFVHPWLSRNEKVTYFLLLLYQLLFGLQVLVTIFAFVFLQDIDSYIAQLKESGYDTFLRVSKNSLSIAADTMIKTATTVTI